MSIIILEADEEEQALCVACSDLSDDGRYVPAGGPEDGIMFICTACDEENDRAFLAGLSPEDFR